MQPERGENAAPARPPGAPRLIRPDVALGLERNQSPVTQGENSPGNDGKAQVLGMNGQQDTKERRGDGLARIAATRFSDLTSHWSKDEVTAAVGQGWVTGYPDGTFRPDKQVTRAEFVKMLAGAIKLTPDSIASELYRAAAADAIKQAPKLTDMDAHWLNRLGWYEPSLAFGLVVPADYTTRHFDPAKPITRREIAVMTVRAMGLIYPAVYYEKEALAFADANQIPTWLNGYVREATQAGVLKGFPNKTIAPERQATRAEAVAMVNRTVAFTKEGSDPTIKVVLKDYHDARDLTAGGISVSLATPAMIRNQVVYIPVSSLFDTANKQLFTGANDPLSYRWDPVRQYMEIDFGTIYGIRSGQEVAEQRLNPRPTPLIVDGEVMVPVHSIDQPLAIAGSNETIWNAETKTLSIYMPKPSAPLGIIPAPPRLVYHDENHLYGYRDETGKDLMPPSIPSGFGFYRGIAAAISPEAWEKAGGQGNALTNTDLIGLMNAKGEFYTSAHYRYITEFNEGVGMFQRGDLKGYIDQTGKEILSGTYDTMQTFSDGLGIAKRIDGKWEFIDRTGKATLIDTPFIAMGNFSEGLAAAQASKDSEQPYLWGYVDKEGKWVIPPSFAEQPQPFSQGLAVVTRQHQEPNGPLLTEIYFINQKGENVFGKTFDSALSFRNGQAPVTVDGKGGVINLKGEYTVPLQTARPLAYYELDPTWYHEGARPYPANNLIGYINPRKQVIKAPTYYDATSFHYGVAHVLIDREKGLYGYIDRAFKIIFTYTHQVPEGPRMS